MSSQEDSSFFPALLSVAALFILEAVVVLSFYLKKYYGVYLWDL